MTCKRKVTTTFLLYPIFNGITIRERIHFVPAGKIQRMREVIEREIQGAKNGLYGLASVSNREAITIRMEHMYDHLQQLYQEGKQEEVRVILTDDDL